MWERFDDYFGAGRAGLGVRVAALAFRSYLRAWDRSVSSARRVDSIVANSSFTADQIRRAYGRQARVVHPFVDVSRFRRPRTPGSHYLMVGAFAPNKRVDLAIQAFNRLRLPLRIVGGGQEEGRLRAVAGPTVEFLGPLSNGSIEGLYSTARAFVFPGVEDFGLTPLEAMASGLPVIAYAAGGALETVVDGESGLFFRQPSVESLVAAVERIESGAVSFDEQRVRARGNAFTKEQFQRGLLREIQSAWVASGKSTNVLESALNPPFRTVES
jgi:glycosyltransferase involved in cell wall biosynthesis